MFNPSWARCLTSAALLATAIPTFAAATVVDFESAPALTVIGPGQSETSYTESGVTFTPTGSDALIDLSFCALGADSCIRNNNTTYLTALNGAKVTITTQRWFNLNSFDASFFPLPAPAGLFSGSPMGLNVVGTLVDGSTLEGNVPLFEDATNPGDFIFSSYFGAGAPMLRSVTLSACVFFGADCVREGVDFDNANYLFNDLQFAIDNLSLTIPEPSALWLVALSLGGLAFTRRRSAR